MPYCISRVEYGLFGRSAGSINDKTDLRRRLVTWHLWIPARPWIGASAYAATIMMMVS